MAEILQPTIFATSSTYIIYAISAYLDLVPTRAADIQFTYYCCILGLISVLVFYVRYLTNENHHSKCNTIYICFLALLVVSYITHWFITPDFAKDSDQKNPMLQVYETDRFSRDQWLKNCEIDKKKCSRPLHLVLQVVFMISILISLIVSLV